MNKILLSTIALSSLLYSNSTTNLENFFNTKFNNNSNFKCSNTKCIGSKLVSSENNTTMKIEKLTINLDFNKNFKFDFNELKKNKISKQKCVSKNFKKNHFETKEQQENKCLQDEKSKIDLDYYTEVMKHFKNLTAINSEYNTIDSINGDKINQKTKHFYFEMDNNIFNLKDINKEDITINDLLFNINLNASGISGNNNKSNLNKIVERSLPSSIEAIQPSMSFDMNNIKKPKELLEIKKINDKFIIMYSTLIDEYLLKENFYEDLNLKLSINKKDENSLSISASSNLKINNASNSDFLLKLNLEKVKETLKLLSKIDLKGFGLLSAGQIIGNNLYYDKGISINKVDKLKVIHENLLKNNKDYLKNYNNIIVSMKNDKLIKELGNDYQLKMFQYESLSLKNDVLALSLINKDNLNSTTLFTMIMNKTPISEVFELIIKKK